MWRTTPPMTGSMSDNSLTPLVEIRCAAFDTGAPSRSRGRTLEVTWGPRCASAMPRSSLGSTRLRNCLSRAELSWKQVRNLFDVAFPQLVGRPTRDPNRLSSPCIWSIQIRSEDRAFASSFGDLRCLGRHRSSLRGRVLGHDQRKDRLARSAETLKTLNRSSACSSALGKLWFCPRRRCRPSAWPRASQHFRTIVQANPAPGPAMSASAFSNISSLSAREFPAPTQLLLQT